MQGKESHQGCPAGHLEEWQARNNRRLPRLWDEDLSDRKHEVTGAWKRNDIEQRLAMVGGWKRGVFLYRSVGIPRSEPLTLSVNCSSGGVLRSTLPGGKMGYQAGILSVNAVS